MLNKNSWDSFPFMLYAMEQEGLIDTHCGKFNKVKRLIEENNYNVEEALNICNLTEYDFTFDEIEELRGLEW